MPNKKIFVILTNACRLVLSLVLIISGFVKAVDPVGSMYKMGEYAALFSMESLSDGWLMFFTVLQIVLEFMLGVFVLMGIYRKFTALATPVAMFFFTVLTIFIYAGDNIEDCGCFGEAVEISNGWTLVKNIVLLALSLLLYFGRNLLVCYISARCRWMVTLFGLFYVGAVQIISYNHLPVIDFGMYEEGADLRTLTQGTPDKYKVLYEYVRGDERCELPEGETPDSTWQRTRSRVVLEEKGTEPVVQGFVVYDWDSDCDVTEEILACPGYACLVVMERVEDASMSRVDIINDFYDHCKENGIPFYATTASNGDEVELWCKRTGAEYKMHFTDDVALRSIVRANPGMLVLKDGVIVSKWDVSDLPPVASFAGNPSKLPDSSVLWAAGMRGWGVWILWFALPLAIISAIDILVARHSKRKAQKRLDAALKEKQQTECNPEQEAVGIQGNEMSPVAEEGKPEEASAAPDMTDGKTEEEKENNNQVINNQ